MRVDRVDDGPVSPDAAVDRVGFAVASVDRVVPERHRAREDPAVVAGRVREDRVAPRAAGDVVVVEPGHEAVVAGSAVDLVRAVERRDRVVAAPAAHARRLPGGADGERLGGVAADVGARRSLDLLDADEVVVLPRAPVVGEVVQRDGDGALADGVVVDDAVEAGPAVDHVGARRLEVVAEELVVAVAAGHVVVAALAVDLVVAVAAAHDVVAGRPEHHVIAITAVERAGSRAEVLQLVVAASAVERRRNRVERRVVGDRQGVVAAAALEQEAGGRVADDVPRVLDAAPLCQRGLRVGGRAARSEGGIRPRR